MAQPTYNVKDLAGNKPGQTRETSAKEVPGGLYRHPEAIDTNTGKPAEMVCLEDPLFGNPQAEAALRLGFVYAGPVPEGYVKNLNDVQAVAPVDADELKGLKARINQLEASRNTATVQDGLKEAGPAYNYDPNAPRDATDESGEAAKQSAVNSHNAREQGDEVALTGTGELVPVAPVDEAPAVSDKALSKQNRTELEATAASVGLEVTDEHDTNKKLATAIQAKQDEVSQDESDDDSEE